MSAGVEGNLLGRAARVANVLGRAGLAHATARGETDAERARRLRLALEELGPTFAKLGQILSTRPDLIPPVFVEELARLQDDVTPLTEAEVVGVMEEELGVPWEDVFESIDPLPLAAGTIGQVHRATLEGGERVVAKVQRPGARDEIMRDLGLLQLFAEKSEGREALRGFVDLPAVVAHLSDSLQRELDFEAEAANVGRLREVLAPFARLDVPNVYERLTTTRLLVLQEIEGGPVRDAPAGKARQEAAKQLLEAYFTQILVDGFFHADPHPGNLRWWQDKIWFLDLGMVGEVTPEIREHVLLLLLAFWQEDVPFLGEIVLALSEVGEGGVDMAALERDLGELMDRYRHTALGEIQIGPILQAVTETASRHGVRPPASLALAGKALAQMQMTAAELDPTLDPFSVVGGFFARDLLSRVRGSADPKRLFYDAQKLKIRATRFGEAVERIAGSRPGPRLAVDVPLIVPLQETIRAASRRMALGFSGGSALLATAVTAGDPDVADWVPLSLGAVGGLFSLLLLSDLFRRR